ncbi:MAG: hypothetical protein MJ025_01340 [Victivallaceae bacterium]|nr:hypothetical protein [Victivallaceae bacterium]
MKTFLANLFDVLNREYRYAVLRNFKGLPDDNPSRDIDILLSRGELSRLRGVLPQLMAQDHCRILYTNEDNQFFTVVIIDDDHEAFQLDFQRNFAWMGIDLLDEERVLDQRVFNGRIYHLPPSLTFLPKYLYSRILGAEYPSKYADVRLSAIAEDGEKINAYLNRMSGGRGGLEYWDATGKWTLRCHAFAAALKCDFSRAMRRMGEFLWRYFLDLFRRRGLMVSFSGPDGCGKTTVIELLRQRLAVNTPVLFHFRPSLLPNLGEVAHKARIIDEVDRDFNQPHRGNRTGLVSSLIRLAYYAFDYSFGYLIAVMPLRQRKHIIFFDRYFTDVIVDGERSRIYLKPGFLAFWRFFLPRCEYNFLFRVDSETILKRKTELTKEDIDVIYSRLELLSSKDRRYHWIDNNGTPESAVNQILDILTKKQGFVR